MHVYVDYFTRKQKTVQKTHYSRLQLTRALQMRITWYHITGRVLPILKHDSVHYLTVDFQVK